MNTNVIFKTIGFAGFVFGAGAIALAMYNRNIKRKYQEVTAEAVVLTDMAKDIAKENFSGANGATSRVKTYLCTDGKRKWFSRTPCTISDNPLGRDVRDYCQTPDGSDGLWTRDNRRNWVCKAKATTM